MNPTIHLSRLFESLGLFPLPEDNPVNQTVALRQLKKLGYEADLASDGTDAVRLFQQYHYDVVLMDCQMPGMDGFEATRQIRQLTNGHEVVRIVTMTAANAMRGGRERCLQAGMDDYISKPDGWKNLRRLSTEPTDHTRQRIWNKPCLQRGMRKPCSRFVRS